MCEQTNRKAVERAVRPHARGIVSMEWSSHEGLEFLLVISNSEWIRSQAGGGVHQVWQVDGVVYHSIYLHVSMLDDMDVARFVLMHELGHARQSQFVQSLGIIAEIHADWQAAAGCRPRQVWKGICGIIKNLRGVNVVLVPDLIVRGCVASVAAALR